jgi:hypothetical protein
VKNKKLFFLVFVLVLFVGVFFYHQDKRHKKGTYLREFSRKKFNKKAKNFQSWAQNQIDSDFCCVNEISQNSVNETYEKIKSSHLPQRFTFFRYLIIDSKIYRFYPKNEEIDFHVLDFEKAILTLSKIVKLPNLDFIYCDLDGLPFDLVNEDFYKTTNQVPILCHAKIKDCENLILIPDHNSLSYEWKKLFYEVLKENQEISWDKKLNKAFWRGGSNDQEYTCDNFEKKPRVIISKLSQKYFDLLDAGITRSWFFQLEDLLRENNLIKEHFSVKKHLEYKYLPVLDGCMCTYPGYQWRLLSNSICFKQQSNQIQWFYLALKPYEEYIPIKNDMSDLLEKISWAQKNDDKCKKIAKNATDFALNNLSMEDMYVYLFEVLKKYSKYQNFDKKVLLKKVDKEDRWININNRKKANKILKKRFQK